MRQKLNTLARIVRVGCTNLFRNSWLTIAATAVMVVALIIIQLAVVLNVTANNAIDELSKSLKVSIYLNDDTTDEARNSLNNDLSSNKYAASVQYISKEEARDRFSDSFQNDQQLLEGLNLVGSDTLPASFEVSVNDLSKTGEIEKIAKDEEHAGSVESITLGRTDARKTIDRAAAAQRFITTASIFAAIIFTVVSALIIFNTIRMAIFTRSEEIRIMKLIGATPDYIRGPFLVEASIYGIIAGVLANSAVYSVILSIGSKVANQAEFAETYRFFTNASTIAACLFGSIFAGVLIGIISSTLAMEKHLKLKHW